MDQSEKRIIGALLLLLGVTMLILGLSSDQISTLINLIRNLFQPAYAGI